jgi:hypothetical protein
MIRRFATLAVACLIIYSHPVVAQWEQAGTLSGGKITSLLLWGNSLFAGTDTGGVFVSTNNGGSWIPADSGLLSLKIRTLAANGNALYAGTYGRGIFRSTDNGHLWTSVNTSLTDTFVSAFASRGDTLYAGVHGGRVDTGSNTGYDGKLFFSTDNGTSWNLVLHKQPYMFTTLFFADSFLFAGTDGLGILASSDNGATWAEANNGLPYVFIWAFVFINNGFLVSIFDPGCDGGGVFRSINNGASWSFANAGLSYSDVRAFATGRGVVFAGIHENGVWYSTNSGGSWAPFNTGYADTGALALAVSDSLIFAGSEAGRIWRRTLFEITCAKPLYSPAPRPHPALTIRSCGCPVSRVILSYRVAQACFVRLELFTISGKRISVLQNHEQGPGLYTMGISSRTLPKGAYTVRFLAGNYRQNNQLLLAE